MQLYAAETREKMVRGLNIQVWRPIFKLDRKIRLTKAGSIPAADIEGVKAMKVTMENKVRCYENMPYKSKNRGSGVDAADTGRNRDSIFIASTISEFKEKQIVGEAVGRVMTDIRSLTPQEKIESLKRQIAEGTYQPDPEQIAACMLAGRRPAANE